MCSQLAKCGKNNLQNLIRRFQRLEASPSRVHRLQTIKTSGTKGLFLGVHALKLLNFDTFSHFLITKTCFLDKNNVNFEKISQKKHIQRQ